VALPDVTFAGAALAAPLSADVFRAEVTEPTAPDRVAIECKFNIATAGFLRTIGARVTAGRLPDESGGTAAGDELVINDALSRALMKDGPVLDRDLRFAGYRGRVVGVVEDLIDRAPGLPAEPQVIAPVANGNVTVIVIRSTIDDVATRAQITPLLTRSWGTFAVSRLSPVSDDVARMTAPWRSRSILLGIIAAFCVPLALTGISGALSYAVRLRSREIAIRLALGAQAARVGREVIGRALMLAALGAAVGIVGGVAAGRLMASQLFNVEPTDALTIASVSAGILMVACLAAIVPAYRAASTSPAGVLKQK
jgi:hypothetical protein